MLNFEKFITTAFGFNSKVNEHFGPYGPNRPLWEEKQISSLNEI